MSHANRTSTLRAVVFCLALAALSSFALEVQTTAQNQPARRKPQAQSSDNAAASSKTSRVTVTSDAPLNDYSAHSAGNRFYVDVPASSAPRVQRGGGVKNVRVLKRGDRTVLEFTLPPGTTARVSQKFNKLDVIIQQSAAAPAGSLASPNAAAPIVASAPAASQPPDASASPRPTPQASPTAMTTANQPRNTAAPTNSLPALNLYQTSPEQNRADAMTPATGDERAGADPADDSGTTTATDSNQTAQAQTPPAATTPAANVESPPLSNNSNGARLVRNWPLVFLAALLLSGLVWLIASRLKTAPPQEAASPSPSRVDDEKVGAQASPASVGVEPVRVERGRVESVSTNGNSGQSNPVETVSRKTARAAATQNPAAIEDERPAKSTGVETSTDAGTSTGAETTTGVATSTDAGTSASAATAKPEHASGLPAAIEASLGSREASERAEAVAQLVFLGSEEALKRIGKAFADPAPQVRDAAARALFKFDKDYVASFSRAMRESKPDVRAHIAASIASSGLAAEAIGSLNGGTEKEIYESFSLLFLMAKAGEIKTLVRAIESHPNIEVRLAVIKLLSMSELSSVVAAFNQLQADPALPARARIAVTEALSQMSVK